MSIALRLRPWIGATLLGAALLLSDTCDYGEVVVVQPAAKGSGALTLSIQADGEDAAVAQALGWSAGIPSAEVTIIAGAGDTAVGPPIATLVTDSAGQVSIPDLPDGKYFIRVHRLLSDAEVARLAPGEDAVGFMTQTVVDRGSVKLPVPASHRRSIVISEWSFFDELVPGVGGYDYGGYLELANNSDTTIYLDGLVVGSGYAQAYDYPLYPCATTGNFSNDPQGVWADSYDSLPGTGRTYPLAPGAVAVIATDAIDHSAISPEGLDLSHADFEGIGSTDADNPLVPNTITIGLHPWLYEHGIWFRDPLAQVVFVSLPVDTAALERRPGPTGGNEYAQVPHSQILDVISLLTTWDRFAYPFCPELVHRSFDRHRARLMQSVVGSEPDAGRWSIQRKVALVRTDGRKILQHTRTSNADLFLGLRTPFRLP